VRRLALLVLAPLAVAPAGCGGGGDTKTTTVTVPARPAKGFDARNVYKRAAPGVVTIIADFDDGSSAQGSGFVVSPSGEVVTNAHVINNGEGRDLEPAKKVYVQFADDNQVAARVVGSDPDADIALLRVKPKGLALKPLALGSSRGLVVGQDVAAIGSPFGERESLSIGVITGLGRDIESLTRFQVSDAIQTDAAINRGNSGGPLVDSRARVVGVNAQISTTGGGNDGVGFAIPADVVRRSIDGLRDGGRVPYAYLGVTTAEVYPQLSRRFKLGTRRGAWLQEVNANGPADDAGLRPGRFDRRFQAESYRVGGDVITSVAGVRVDDDGDLSTVLAAREPGDRVKVRVYRKGKPRTVTVRLGRRPLTNP
jgi:S1-C subfamily serine protease